jgi:hypothetical protein
MTRDEHLAWAKGRALAYLPHEPQTAFTSMCSDLGKHDAFNTPAAQAVMLIGMVLVINKPTGDQMRQWIEDWR